MPVIRVEQVHDPRLDDYRNVSDAELLRQRGLFAAEGRMVVRRVLAGAHKVVSLVVNEPSLQSLLADFSGVLDNIPVYLCPTAELAEIVGFNFHRGCLAMVRRPADRLVTDAVSGARLVLVLDGVSDADNVGSAFRNAAAFGVDAVLLNACCDPLYRKAVRTSMGHVLQMAYARMLDYTHELAALKASGFTLLALTPDIHAGSIADFMGARPAMKTALIAGSEANGVSAETERMADARVRIPMAHGVDSLNVATAMAIALFALTSQSGDRS